ncbi:L,D-transpeptidase family protein [Salipiger abyssi]|uniref:L,D-transpeptidase family protein n=1 Tax=Salipiger abyssi TaxID=1250539 RepID=UPI001A8F3E04|nr:L,D-transpeptidase family protein [Salipiger abyssi]MBN9889566.1 L,D-transpeptidase family protein [Salipiger abyssi]
MEMVLTSLGLRFAGRVWPCSIGRGGIRADKREGDGATPVGAHRIVGTLYRPDRVARPAPWADPILPGDLWSDDAGDPAYNTLVRAPYAPSHECMRRADPLYDIVLLTDWNWPDAVPGRGSAIFLHQWRRPGFPTEGCIAFRRDHLRQIAVLAAPGTRLIVPETMAG